MKNKWGLVVWTIVVCVGMSLLFEARAQRRRTPFFRTSTIGRYQINGNIRIDTTTGRTWELKRMTCDDLPGVVDDENKSRFWWYECFTNSRPYDHGHGRGSGATRDPRTPPPRLPANP